MTIRFWCFYSYLVDDTHSRLQMILYSNSFLPFVVLHEMMKGIHNYIIIIYHFLCHYSHCMGNSLPMYLLII
jgi:hypothetical protein